MQHHFVVVVDDNDDSVYLDFETLDAKFYDGEVFDSSIQDWKRFDSDPETKAAYAKAQSKLEEILQTGLEEM